MSYSLPDIYYSRCHVQTKKEIILKKMIEVRYKVFRRKVVVVPGWSKANSEVLSF